MYILIIIPYSCATAANVNILAVYLTNKCNVATKNFAAMKVSKRRGDVACQKAEKLKRSR